MSLGTVVLDEIRELCAQEESSLLDRLRSLCRSAPEADAPGVQQLGPERCQSDIKNIKYCV
jgi:hypothetical protein